MPDSSFAAPDAISSKPLMCAKKPWPGLCVSGFTARSIEYLMSEATQLAAIVELDAFAQLEGVDQPVVRDGVAFREVGDQLGRAGLVVHEPVEQALDHRPVLPVVADRGVERGDVVLVGDHHLAALLGLAPAPWLRPTSGRWPPQRLRISSTCLVPPSRGSFLSPDPGHDASRGGRGDQSTKSRCRRAGCR